MVVERRTQLLLGVIQKRPLLLEEGSGLHAGFVTEQRADLPERERGVAAVSSGCESTS